MLSIAINMFRQWARSAEVIPIFSHVTSCLDDLNVWYKRINNYADGKQFEKASLSLKHLSDMITWVFDHASLYFLKTSTVDYMTVLVSSAKINKATISLKPSLPTISSKYTSIQLICTWHQPTKFLVISQTSHSCINLDKIVIWSSFPSRLVPRFEIGQDTKTFAYFFNWVPSPDYQIIDQKTKAGCLNLLHNLLNLNLIS